MNPRRGGLIALWAGVLAGAFVAVRHTDHLAWAAYTAAAALALLGVVLLRRSAFAETTDTEQLARDVCGLSATLEIVGNALTALVDAMPKPEVYDVRDRIDATLAEPLSQFADRREAMIAAYGLDVYAEVMTRFAAAERLINRAWSASADGYVDEVWPCLTRSQSLMQGALSRLRAASRQRSPDA